jgi:predicted TIM-barrel fold metal-dependent hydrolase
MATALLFVLLASPAGSAAPAEPIIDMHVHAYETDGRWAARIANPVTGQKMTATDEAAHRKATFDAMDRASVVKAVVCGDQFAAVRRFKEAAPARVLAGYGFDDPARVDSAFLRAEHAAGRLEVIAEVGSQYQGIAPNDPRMEPVYALAEELDVPLGLHMHPGPPGATTLGSPKMRPSLGNPLLLEDVLARHPKLRLFVMHAGWPFLDEMVGLMHSYPSLYVEIGVIDWTRPRDDFHGFLRGLVKAGLGRRVMFGSDQMVWPEAIEMAAARIREADYLTPRQRRDILHDNAARFLRLMPATRVAPEGAMETLPRE